MSATIARLHPVLALCLVLLPNATAQSYRLRTVVGGSYAGDGELATQALLQQPQGLAAAADGTIYVADAADHRVRRIHANGVITTVAGDGVPGFRGDGGPAALARLRNPYGLALDAAGNVYVADLGNARVRRIGKDGTITTVLGGGNVALESGLPATDVQLQAPRNVAVDAGGVLYVSEFALHRVLRVQDGAVTVVAGTGTAGNVGDQGPAVSAQLSAPAGLAVAADGALYVADSGNRRVRRVQGGTIAALPARVSSPVELAVDARRALYIADTSGTLWYAQETGTAASLNGVTARGLALDRAGRLLVSTEYQVGTWDAASRKLLVAAGRATAETWGEGRAAHQTHLGAPVAITTDLAGNLYLADAAHKRVRRVGLDGRIMTVLGGGTATLTDTPRPALTVALARPSGVAVDAMGTLFVADSEAHRVYALGRDGLARTVAGTGTPGDAGDGKSAAAASLAAPFGLATDQYGQLYIADSGNHAVRRIRRDGVIETVAGTGMPGYSGEGGPAALAQLNTPLAVALDRNGTLWIADTGNLAVRRVSPNGRIETVADATPSYWPRPSGIAVAADGTVYISDEAQHRVWQWRPDNTAEPIAGTGEPGFVTNSEMPGLESALSAPIGLAVTTDGSLLVADRDNQRIRELRRDLTASPAVNLTAPGLRHGAGFAVTAITPGQLLLVVGDGVGAYTPALSPLQGGVAKTVLEGVEVHINGVPAPVLHVLPNEVLIQVPSATPVSGNVTIDVLRQGVRRARLTVSGAPASPGLFADAAGRGPVQAWTEEGALVKPEMGVPQGTVLTMLVTGEGLTTPAGADGHAHRNPSTQPVLPLRVEIAGYDAEVLRIQPHPGTVGLMGVTVRVPAGYMPSGVLPVTVVVGEIRSQPGVTLRVE